MSERVVECAHNSYWRGVYGTCMVCRAEQAEAALAQAEREREDYKKVVEIRNVLLDRLEGALADAGSVSTVAIETGIRTLTAERDAALAEVERLRERQDLNERTVLHERHRAEQAEARVRALEGALREMLDVAERLAWYAARAGSVTVGQYDGRIVRARAALARPTPTPDQRQYGKTCAHDGYVVAGCRDCEARATTPTPGEGAGR